jgi:hypothetical protein
MMRIVKADPPGKQKVIVSIMKFGIGIVIETATVALLMAIVLFISLLGW